MNQRQVILFSSLLLASTAQAATPKYVSYFIGDGMGSAQRQVAEYYLQQQQHDPALHLAMDTLPVTGITTTHSADSLITDSAAAGTALAAGVKTNNGVIGLLPDGRKVTTLLEQARDHGMKTGIITTTRLTHATPASFISKNPDRDNENAIAEEFVTSKVDYMAGGGYRHFIDKNAGLKTKRTDDKDLVSVLKKAGYTTFISEKSTQNFMNYQPKAGEKVFGAFSASHLPYSLDQTQKADTPTLAQLVDKGVALLSQEGQKKGFFMMVEGGRIDHAGHAHDITANIADTLAMDNAVKSALDFYHKHPKETLIVVAADHETGGMGLGFGKNYYLKLDQLAKVKQSIEDKTQKLYTGDRAAFYATIGKQFGLTDLSVDEKHIIEQALDVADKKDQTPDENQWGEYDPAAIGVAHVISQRANVYWTTYAHTGVQVPLSAIGVDAQQFGGFKDNTEVAKTMANIMKFKIGA